MARDVQGEDNSADEEERAGEVVENYRGVTIMPALYKIYAVVLTERIKEDMKEKEVLPPNQTRFRKGMSTIDNIYEGSPRSTRPDV